MILQSILLLKKEKRFSAKSAAHELFGHERHRKEATVRI